MRTLKMKRVLLIFTLVFTSTILSAQAFHSMSIESQDDYNARKYMSNSDNEYDSNAQNKEYIEMSFYNKDKTQLMYDFYSDGDIYYGIDDIWGKYYVGEEIGYKRYRVYIRWNHGGKTEGWLDYATLSSGKPIFKRSISGGTQVNYPR